MTPRRGHTLRCGLTARASGGCAGSGGRGARASGNRGGGLPVAAGMVRAALFLGRAPPRHAHGMVELFAQSWPFVSELFCRAGQFPGLPDHAVRFLEADRVVMVFPEGARAEAGTARLEAQRSVGGENDSPSRNLSRWLAALDDTGLAVRQVWRADRMGRGGDHLPFQEAGYPAVRFTVAVENYERQHQTVRSEA